MKVELIPVIEITNYTKDIVLPDKGPYWEHRDDWETYNNLCNQSAGFSEKLKPYIKGSSLYKINEISDSDLFKVIQTEITLNQTDEKNDAGYLNCALSGGYILRINNEDIYFPQCCGDLADLLQWENLTIGKTEQFYPGHPSPRVKEIENSICFDFKDIENNEKFAPEPTLNKVEIKKSELVSALVETKKELKVFAERLKLINQTENLNIINIDKQLIWGELE